MGSRDVPMGSREHSTELKNWVGGCGVALGGGTCERTARDHLGDLLDLLGLGESGPSCLGGSRSLLLGHLGLLLLGRLGLRAAGTHLGEPLLLLVIREGNPAVLCGLGPLLRGHLGLLDLECGICNDRRLACPHLGDAVGLGLIREGGPAGLGSVGAGVGGGGRHSGSV